MKHIINYLIGDWIVVEGNPVQIAAVHQKKIGYHKYPGRLSWMRLDRVQTIPLTPDFLLKNGFTRKDDSYVWKIIAGDGYFCITLIDRLDGIWDMTIENYSKISEDQVKKEVTGKFLKIHHVQHEFVGEGIKKEFVM